MSLLSEYELYMASPEWEQLRMTHPDPPQCIACDSTRELQMHHMRYPENIWETEHWQCCWLCVRCHECFHRGLIAGRKQGYELKCASDSALKDFTRAVIRAQRRSEECRPAFADLTNLSPQKLAAWFTRDRQIKQRRRP